MPLRFAGEPPQPPEVIATEEFGGSEKSIIGCDGDAGPIQLKQEPLDDGPIRNIQKVPSLSDLSDPEASLDKAKRGDALSNAQEMKHV
ncbi:ETS-like protein pointed, isoform P2/D-like protein [Anopheles sinensis]|uniref:ETS-like protein pointed, isoform P2/D-like protein n=1 Tax=Anopheles sinensis TaxID=74873 RepID=A0A084W7V2_ANOSI|nr:ETS-like protein pointed, isoform P2/D-like protein [Anopheles sinensis]